MSLHLLLYIIAAVLIGLAAFGVGAPRVSLAWLGMLLWLVAYAFVPLL